MDTTRRDFIGAMAAVGALPLIGESAERDGRFQDIRVDRYYELQGGHYGDTGGYGCPGHEIGAKLIGNMKYWKQCRYLEDTVESVEERGFYLTPTQYFCAPRRKFDRICLTRDWMLEFCRRHRDEPLESWELRYRRYLDDVNSGMYTPDSIY